VFFNWHQKSSLSAQHDPLSSDADVRAEESAVAENGSDSDFAPGGGKQSAAPSTLLHLCNRGRN